MPRVLVVSHTVTGRVCFCVFVFRRVFGSVAVVQLANDLQPLPVIKRPLYCFTMKGVVTCFTGMRDRNLVVSLGAIPLAARAGRGAAP